MNPNLPPVPGQDVSPGCVLAGAAPRPAPAEPTFSVRRLPEAPAYHQLTLEDASGCIANWVIPASLKKLNKKSVMLWLLPASAQPTSLPYVEAGAVHPVPAQDGSVPNLRTKLTQGLLQLNFGGQVLRGYHRLRCLPGGNGQLWQLTPVGYL